MSSNTHFRTDLQRILFDEGRRQTWLAKRAGIHPTTLSLIVNGRLHPTHDQAEAIARVLGRTVDELGLEIVEPAGRAVA